MNKTSLFISNFDIKSLQRLFVKILLFVPVLFFVAAVNIYVDPAGLYRKTVDKHETDEYRIARELAAGKDVTIIRPIDDRLLEKYFVENLTVAPDIVVLGSSHSAWLGDNIFPDKKVVNNSVLTPVLADYLGIFEGYAQKNLYPKRVICVLDPQLIESPVKSEEWLSIKDDTYRMLKRLGITSEKIKQPLIPQKWFNIFSFSYFQESMKKLWDRHNQPTFSVNKGIAGRELLFKDGRRLLDWWFLAMNTEMTTRKLFLGRYAQELKNPMKPNKELEGILEHFIRYLTGHHIQVTLCLLPLSPRLYKSFLEEQKRQGALDIAGFEHYYKGLAQRLNLEIIGSYDPAACNLEDKDFYDEDHIRTEVIEKIFKQKGSVCSMPGL